MFSFFFLPPSICFFKRDKKRRCEYGIGDGKELEKCRDFFFGSPFCVTECVFILTPCNIYAVSKS